MYAVTFPWIYLLLWCGFHQQYTPNQYSSPLMNRPLMYLVVLSFDCIPVMKSSARDDFHVENKWFLKRNVARGNNERLCICEPCVKPPAVQRWPSTLSTLTWSETWRSLSFCISKRRTRRGRPAVRIWQCCVSASDTGVSGFDAMLFLEDRLSRFLRSTLSRQAEDLERWVAGGHGHVLDDWRRPDPVVHSLLLYSGDGATRRRSAGGENA